MPGMLLRLRPVIGHDVAHGQTAGNGVHRRQPAVDLAFHEMRTRIAERGRQRFQCGVDQLLIRQIGEGQRVGAGNQPVQHAVLADVMTRALVVDAAAAEGFRHEPGAGNLPAPERCVEQDRDAQIVRGTIEIRDVLDHRLAELLAFPAHGREPRMRQADQHEVEVARLRPLAVHHLQLVAAGRRLADGEHAVIELDVGVDLRLQALDQLLVAVLYGIEADIAVDIHQIVLERVEPVGVVAFGRDVGARHHLEETLCGFVLDRLVEHLLGGLVGPGILVVVRADALVIFDRRHRLGAAVPERLDRSRSLGAVFAAHARDVVEELAAELHLLGVHRNGLKSEMLDQLAQRIGTRHRVVVDLGNAGLVHRRRGIEFARDDLAAEPVGGLVDGDAAEVAELTLQVPGAHQPAGAAAYDCEIKHMSSVVSGPAPVTGPPV
ncbi:hypothetical protein ABIF90_009610 [Bradyrhizobium japonicum]